LPVYFQELGHSESHDFLKLMRSEKDESFVDFAKLSSVDHYYVWENSQGGRLIYISVLIFIFSLIFSLPFIKVDISVKAPGIIRPVCEKTEITSMVSGRIDKIYYGEGTVVEKGQLLVTLECNQIRDEFEYYKYENSLLLNEITDLKNLLAGNDTTMISVRYRFEYSSYMNQLCKVQEQLDKARKEKERLKMLFMEKLISDKEYDDLNYAQSQLEKEVNYLISASMNRWQVELSRLRYQIGHTNSEISRIENELSQCEIIAPVSGRIDQLSGIYNGSVIHAGQDLATISPDTSLIGEVYITPDDIGLIKSDQEVILIIDAFDYREWGTIHGKIKDIPDDFILIDNQPVFRIKCMPDKDFLYLKNGIKGQLKKGMTFQARCIITTRSIAHLLIGRLDSWINPAISKQTFGKQ
jgi:HlyD family secretion protein